MFETRVGDRSRASQAEYRVKRLAKADKELLIAGGLSVADLWQDDSPQASGASGG